jgi:hypothetical protein
MSSVGLWLITLECGVAALAAAGERNERTQRRSIHTRQVIKALEKLLMERSALLSC